MTVKLADIRKQRAVASALKRTTQSRTTCSVTPPASAASVRLPPS
jgi:hypothetical protein